MSGVDYDGTRLRKGAGDAILRWVADEGGQAPPELAGRARPDRPRGRHAARRRARQPGARRRLPEGRGQGGHARPLRPAARDGHPHGHGHRRQPRSPRRRSPRSPASTTSSPRPRPRRKLELIREQQARRPAGRDDRRRHQRRAGARAGRRRRGDEHRHPGGARGGQHGRPRLQPDEADRDRRGRQAAADHARRADDVLDRQRRRQVLRDPAGDLRRDLRRRRARPARSTSSTSWTSARPSRRSSRRSSSTR